MAAIDNSLVSSRRGERRSVCAAERACNLLRRLHGANLSACPSAPLRAIMHDKHQLVVHAVGVMAGLQKRLTSPDNSLLRRKK